MLYGVLNRIFGSTEAQSARLIKPVLYNAWSTIPVVINAGVTVESDWSSDCDKIINQGSEYQAGRKYISFVVLKLMGEHKALSLT